MTEGGAANPPVCPVCGSPIQGRYCHSCGEDLEQYTKVPLRSQWSPALAPGFVAHFKREPGSSEAAAATPVPARRSARFGIVRSIVLAAAIGLIYLVVQLVHAVATFHPSGPYKAPTSFVVSDASVAGAVRGAVDTAQDSPGLSGPPQVRCSSDGTRCRITYAVKEPSGISTDLELIEPTRQIWKALFTDSRFADGTITVEGPLTSVGGQSSNGPLFSLRCDRGSADLIDWDHVDGAGLRKLCVYERRASGV